MFSWLRISVAGWRIAGIRSDKTISFKILLLTFIDCRCIHALTKELLYNTSRAQIEYKARWIFRTTLHQITRLVDAVRSWFTSKAYNSYSAWTDRLLNTVCNLGYVWGNFTVTYVQQSNVCEAYDIVSAGLSTATSCECCLESSILSKWVMHQPYENCVYLKDPEPLF